MAKIYHHLKQFQNWQLIHYFCEWIFSLQKIIYDKVRVGCPKLGHTILFFFSSSTCKPITFNSSLKQILFLSGRGCAHNAPSPHSKHPSWIHYYVYFSLNVHSIIRDLSTGDVKTSSDEEIYNSIDVKLRINPHKPCITNKCAYIWLIPHNSADNMNLQENVLRYFADQFSGKP